MIFCVQYIRDGDKVPRKIFMTQNSMTSVQFTFFGLPIPFLLIAASVFFALYISLLCSVIVLLSNL